MHSAKKSGDGAGTATIQPSMKDVLDREDDIDSEQAGCKDSFPVEQVDGADQRELERPTGLTDGASRSMGRGGDTTRGRWGKDIGRKGDIDGEEAEGRSATTVEHAGGADRLAHAAVLSF